MKRSGVALAMLLVGFGVFAGTTPEQASATPCALAPTSVAVVVDFGDGSPVSAVCVPADSSDSGAAVLAARARQLGTPQPRYASSGLLCAIDGYPSDGCGTQNSDTYAYWSYWHGTGANWEYQNIGPASWRARGDVVEGWRFEPRGAGNPTDPPPDASPDPAATCAPPSTSTSTSTSTSESASTDSVVDAGPSAAEPSSTFSSTSAVSSGTTITSTPTSASTPNSVVTTSSASSATTTSTVQAATGRVRVSSPAARSSPWPAVGAGALIIGLGATGAVMARRRRTGH